MSDTDTLIIDTTTRIFRELGDPQTVNNAVDDAWREPLWAALEEAGLSRAWTADDLGGAGAGMRDGFDILRTAGAYAVAVPLAETLLAAWVLEQAGLVCPEGAMTVALAGRENRVTMSDGALTGTARAVPFAAAAKHIVVLADGADGSLVARADAADLRIGEGTALSGDAMADVQFENIAAADAASTPDSLGGETVMLMGAAIRAAQMAGALEGLLQIAVGYAQERQAFGRPIAKFQAVQHNLARLAGETAAAVAVAGSAADAIATADTFDEAVFLEVAAAKIRAGEAAGEGAAIAHQVMGAIGFTDEHILQRYTRRLWSWRDDFGSESEWAAGLGAMVAAAGADELWPLVASR